MIKKSFIFSILLGLFLALNLYMLFLYYLTPEFKWISFEYQIKSYMENALLFFTIGLFASVFFAVIIGFPLYWIAKRYSAVNLITCSLGGIAVTTVPYAVCILMGWDIPGAADKSGQVLLFVVVFCGAVGGFIFDILERSNK